MAFTPCPKCGRAMQSGRKRCEACSPAEAAPARAAPTPRRARGYIENNLAPGETIAARAQMHWALFVVPAALTLAGIICLLVGSAEAPGPLIFGVIVLPFGLYTLAKTAIIYRTTELAATNRRVIAKTGFIQRDTVEMNLSKVESISVKQPITGRIFGFGTIIVQGSGGGITPFPGIDSPLEFRKVALEQIDAQSTSSAR